MVYFYDIKQNLWDASPNLLNTARKWHSTCVLGESMVYVFFGRRLNNSTVRSIESWNAREHLINGTNNVCWNHIKLHEYERKSLLNAVPWRQNPNIAPLNDTQIMIYGGSDGKNLFKTANILDVDPKTKHLYVVDKELEKHLKTDNIKV